MRDLFVYSIAEFREILSQAQNDMPRIGDFSRHRSKSAQKCPVAKGETLKVGSGRRWEMANGKIENAKMTK
jgi:hypothetical protein